MVVSQIRRKLDATRSADPAPAAAQASSLAPQRGGQSLLPPSTRRLLSPESVVSSLQVLILYSSTPHFWNLDVLMISVLGIHCRATTD